MNKIILFLLFFISLEALASAGAILRFPQKEIRQGSLAEGQLLLDPETAQKLELQKLKGQTLGDTLYVYSISPLMRKEGGPGYEADLKVVFIKVPEKTSLSHKLPDGELELTFPDLTVLPTEAPGTFIYGNFSIPNRPRLILWGSILLALISILLIGRKFYFSQRKKKRAKERRSRLKAELLGGKEYSDVVDVWMRRNEFLKEFPEIGPELKKLELTLFKYQFKSSQTNEEKNQVLDAYKVFRNAVTGRISGV